ncbi:Metal transporter CNNM4 [Thelohanellus kitauei]|uniref:Metal transporter CNNM4 n=1 Tax=Thelohanellus kitauei TaxID=669202 RepID=A0A0C2NE11_THEKT|nr:Metal transporter CNNM4 [Thelohanellus kitauei]
MTKIENVFSIDENDVLDLKTISDIFKSGFSRIPVFRGSHDNITGILYVKDITFVDTEDNVHVQNILKFFNRPVIYVKHDTKLDRLLKEFKKGVSHLAIVVSSDEIDGAMKFKAIGIITLEDIIEEIIESEILDEKDAQKYINEKRHIKMTNSFRTSSFLESKKQDDIYLTDNMISTICEFLSTCTSYVYFQPSKRLIPEIFP